MKEIYFEYNPFTLEFIVKEDGEKFDSESQIYEYINGKKRLQFWLDKLIPILYENINDNFNLTFKGTVLDYEDLQLEVDHFNKTNKTNINLIYKEVRSVDDRLKELKNIFQYMIDTAPFEELKEKKVIEQFNDAIGKEFELAVIATMSSGKSTLLNSFLGKELMPSKNQACTATIARIKDVDGMNGTSVICLDANENIVIDEVSNVTVKDMREFNDNEKVSYIDIKTDIPFVSSHNLELVLLDTPGPNNSRDERHKEKTYKVINESDPLVLYVLNATQLSTNDDNLLLSSVSKAMEKAGKQAKDRFLFVVNKLDAFDLEAGDSIEKAYGDVVSYLKSHKIENPNIYLVSAHTALITRLIKNNYGISRKQKGDFETIKSLFEEFDELHLSKYAALSKSGHDKINTMLKNAEDELDTLLIHSGIPAVEIAINDYLEKYAMSEKIAKGVTTFIGYIKEINMENNIADALAGNEAKLKQFNDRIAYVSKQIADGNRGKEYKKRIEELGISKEISDELNRIVSVFGDRLYEATNYAVQVVSGKKLPPLAKAAAALPAIPAALAFAPLAAVGAALGIGGIFGALAGNNDPYIVSKSKGEEYIRRFEEIVKELLISFSAEIESQIYSDIIEFSNTMIDEYRQEINSLSEEIDIDEFERDKSAFQFNDLFDSSINELRLGMDKHIKGKGISFKKVGIIPFIDIRITDKFDILEYNHDILAKIFDNIQKECVRIEKYANEELIKGIKEKFLSQIDELEIVVSKKIDSLKNMTSSKEQVEKFMAENKKNKLWLEDFINRLNSVIEL